MRANLRAFILGSALAGAAYAGTVTDPALGYSINLPAGWVQVKSKANQHYFRDSTRSYRGQISIVKYAIDKTDYPTPRDWSQAQFIAYKLNVETSVFPFGAVAYYDSSSGAKLGADWAPEIFSVLYPADGDPNYCEYVRYCALGSSGYEIYAIGDSTEMTRNVDYYAGIIATLQFSEPILGLAPERRAASRSPGNAGRYGTYDLVGRKPAGFRPAADRHAEAFRPLVGENGFLFFAR